MIPFNQARKERLSPPLSLPLSRKMALRQDKAFEHISQWKLQEKSKMNPIERALKPIILNV